ncbi:MAG: family 10 glycosylhydrolase [Nodosilinea sp.]
MLGVGLQQPMALRAQTVPGESPAVYERGNTATKQLPSESDFPELEPGAPSIVPAPSVIPTDIDQHWAVDCLTALAQARVIAGDQNGRFYPDEPILWGDYVALLNQMVPPGLADGGANALERALGVTHTPSVAAHYPGQYYQADRPLVRAEAMMALAAKLGADYAIAANTLINDSLRDGPQVLDYTREGVAAALTQDVVVNYPQADQLNPTQRLTRGEAAALVCRASPSGDLRRWIEPSWVAQAQVPETVAAADREMRGVWLTNIDSQVLFSKDALSAAVDRLAELNFNTLYPTVWNWGYTLYPSRTAERELGDSQHLYGELSTPSLEDSQGERDMLQEAVELGHAKNMAVIPWFEFGFMAPANYELYRRRPDWFTQTRVEPTILPIPQPRPEDRDAPADLLKAVDKVREKNRVEHWLGQSDLDLPPAPDPGIWLEGDVLPRRWMNPFHPQVQKLMLELINDLVSNYEVDGFQFDDHLGLPVEFGYDPYTINLYRADHNGQEPPENYQDEEWMAWRANKISDFLAEVYKLVKARRPQAVVSISPNPYPFAYTNYLQDWPTWISRGLVDELVIQIYRSDPNRFIWEMNKPSARGALDQIPTSVGILSGLRADPVGVEPITTQVMAARDRRYSGVSFFFYESLWISPPRETLDDRTAALGQAFPTAVARPEG